ncbi:MAG: 2-C-methyl-D-erythritol 4-phosphate cytidylyltransferase, partial [Alphaproteobacteria bacterium]|nr:2-C-methyl-D-erythritol 4-phosphate cytidylyltransferase [Alphaproteobacteria bacterium]MDX5492503.1 2-C-methyl-D-erythritol 4-phosphate cytidylyltransferase [Alphaproteobacteria bacterium]
MKVAALIVAAGRGSRAGPGAPKQYRLIAGEPVLRRTLAAFSSHQGISCLLTVIHPEDAEAYQAAAKGLGKLLPAVPGGPSRQASVLAGLEALAGTQAPDLVLIHDGARPFVSHRLIDDCIGALASHDGALVPGDEDNFKITSAQDIERAERMLMRGGETRTGMGY